MSQKYHKNKLKTTNTQFSSLSTSCTDHWANLWKKKTLTSFSKKCTTFWLFLQISFLSLTSEVKGKDWRSNKTKKLISVQIIEIICFSQRHVRPAGMEPHHSCFLMWDSQEAEASLPPQECNINCILWVCAGHMHIPCYQTCNNLCAAETRLYNRGCHVSSDEQRTHGWALIG